LLKRRHEGAQEVVPVKSILFLAVAVAGHAEVPDETPNGKQAATASEECGKDLEAIPDFLEANDAGARDELAQWGELHFANALTKARDDVAQVSNREECRIALNAYLKAWRKGHLLVITVTPAPSIAPASAPGTGAAADPTGAGSNSTSANIHPFLLPTIRSLSAKTTLLTIPSFAGDYRQPLIELIAEHRRDLKSHANWIIDACEH